MLMKSKEKLTGEVISSTKYIFDLQFVAWFWILSSLDLPLPFKKQYSCIKEQGVQVNQNWSWMTKV